MNSNQVADVPKSFSESVNDLIAEGGHALPSDDKKIVTDRKWNADIAHLSPKARAHLLAKYSIAYNGRPYEKGGYRYDILADAIRYAKLQRSRGRNEIGPQKNAEHVEAPNEFQRRVMAELDISYENGVYTFDSCHYERLNDAVNYAQLHFPAQS